MSGSQFRFDRTSFALSLGLSFSQIDNQFVCFPAGKVSDECLPPEKQIQLDWFFEEKEK